MRIGTFKPLIILCVWCRNRKNFVSSSLALKKNASVQNRCKGEKVNVPYASEKGPLVGKERALNEIKNTAAESRGDIRKRRRKRSAFAGFAASKPLDNHQGCRGGASREEPGGFFNRPGRSAKQGGRMIDAPAARAPGFWMHKILRQNRRFLVPHRLNCGVYCWNIQTL